MFGTMDENIFFMSKMFDRFESVYFGPPKLVSTSNDPVRELKGMAYDYYFFLKLNYLFDKGITEQNNYFSYYIKTLFCLNSSRKNNNPDLAKVINKSALFSVGEIEIDILTKYISAKTLEKWMQQYNVENLQVRDKDEVVKKFVLFCNNFCKYYMGFPIDSFKCFVLILDKIEIDEKNFSKIEKCFIKMLGDLVQEKVGVVEANLGAIELFMRKIIPSEHSKFRTKVLSALINQKVLEAVYENRMCNVYYLDNIIIDNYTHTNAVIKRKAASIINDEHNYCRKGDIFNTLGSLLPVADLKKLLKTIFPL